MHDSRFIEQFVETQLFVVYALKRKLNRERIIKELVFELEGEPGPSGAWWLYRKIRYPAGIKRPI